jgi:hypothetical protein
MQEKQEENIRDIEEELGYLDTLIYALSNSFSEDMEECKESGDVLRINRRLKVYRAVVAEIMASCSDIDGLIEDAIRQTE